MRRIDPRYINSFDRCSSRKQEEETISTFTATENGTLLYLELIKKILTNTIYEDRTYTKSEDGPELATKDYNYSAREQGGDWPVLAHTMVGVKRLDNVQTCMETVLTEEIPGDFIETGVWRGGVCIFMRALLKVHAYTDRKVWVADSFQGLPDPNERDIDAPEFNHENKDSSHQGFMRSIRNDYLAVSLDAVQENFRRYGLLDDQVRFLPGWFSETLPNAPIERLALLRLDGDHYNSTKDALENLYPKLSPGGFVIIDDFALSGCRNAVEDFRRENKIEDEVQSIDWTGVYWRKRI